MLKKVLSFLLVALIFHSTSLVFASGRDDEQLVAKIRSQVTKIGTGEKARVKVKLKDGTKIAGFITEADSEKFVVLNEKTGQRTPIPYPQVNNLSKRAIGFIVVGAIFATLIILLATTKD